MNKITTRSNSFLLHEIKIKPILRWAGGKAWILKYIDDIIKHDFYNYHEPFLGGGSVFFHLKPNQQSFLSDTNSELINVYKQMKLHPVHLIRSLENMKNSKEEYERIKKERPKTNLEKASRFIFLNKTSFNGIYRVNSKGEYNVPYGNNPYVSIVETPNFFNASTLLKRAHLKACDFGETLDFIEKKDLVFLDPPYTVAHKNNGFIEYNKKIFSWLDQERLADFINEIIKRRAFFILTNAAHESITSLYGRFGEKREVLRKSTIGGKNAKRQEISEFIFTNIN